MGLKTIKAHKGQRIKLTPSPEMLANNKAFKEWEVLSNNVTIGEDNTFEVGLEDVTKRANYYDVVNIQGNYTFPKSALSGQCQYLLNVEGAFSYPETTLESKANFYKDVKVSDSIIQNNKEPILTGKAEHTIPSFNVQGTFKYENIEQLKGQANRGNNVKFDITVGKHSIECLVTNDNAIYVKSNITYDNVTFNGQVNSGCNIQSNITLDSISTNSEIKHYANVQGVFQNNAQHVLNGQVEYTLPLESVQRTFKYESIEQLKGKKVETISTVNSNLKLSSSIIGQIEVESDIVIDKHSIKGLVGNYDKVICDGDVLLGQITSNALLNHGNSIQGDITIPSQIISNNTFANLGNNIQGDVISGQIASDGKLDSSVIIKANIQGQITSNALLNHGNSIHGDIIYPEIISNGQTNFSVQVLTQGNITFDNILSNSQITYLKPNTNQGEGANDPNHPNYGTPEYCNLNLFHPSNKCEFKDYCLRRLGKPVIQINVSDSQIEDLIAEGVDYFQLYHYDGSETLYYPITITKEIIQSQTIPIDSSKFIGVNRLLESSFYGQSQFTVEWQLMASTYPYALKGDGLLTYYQAMQYQSLLRLMVSGKTKNIRFSRHTNRLHLNCDWSSLKEGQVFVAEVVQRIDPNDNPSLWNDPFLKEYVTALIKLQWGNNLRKLKGVQMIGGVQIDADGILNEAIQELQNLKENMIWKHQEPLDFWMG